MNPRVRRATLSGGRPAQAEPIVRRLGSIFAAGRWRFLLLDGLAVCLAVVVAFGLRYDTLDGIRIAALWAPVVITILVVRGITHVRLGLYQRLWRYASVADLLHVLAAVAIGSVISILIAYGLLWPLGVPMSAFPGAFWVVEAMLCLGFVSAPRLGLRTAQEFRIGRSTSHSPQRGVPTLLFGAGEAGALLARSALRDARAGVEPVGFLDDDASRSGQRVAGLPVFGTLDDLRRAIAWTEARQLLITMPKAAGADVKRVTNAGLDAGLEVRTVPPLHELLDGTLSAYQVRRIQVEDLLRRPQATERLPGVGRLIRGRTVMITGGGGSIGRELARQVWSLEPGRLVLVDRAESALYTVERELEVDLRRPGSTSTLSVHLANVASRLVMERLISRTQPDVIFHAAAYKHVPLMETHPSDAVHVNIGGTLAVLEAAAAAGVGRFVLVSTDKAVEPANVMGATKRVAEWLVADVGLQAGRPYVSVRFGNVLGSNGSVVPIFQTQLERGEPLTITDPEMTRYFMTIPEAAWLVLDAAAIGTAGDLFVLDMGDPINIVDLAKDLARLAGRDPESVPMIVTGLRPGEKLTEELYFDSEQVQPTASPKIMLASSGPPPAGIRIAAAQLLTLANGENEAGVREALFRLVDDPADWAWTNGPATAFMGRADVRSRDPVPVMAEEQSGHPIAGKRPRATRTAAVGEPDRT